MADAPIINSTAETRKVALALAVQVAKVEAEAVLDLANDIEAYIATGKIPE